MCDREFDCSKSAVATQISANARALFRKHTEKELNAIVDVIESSIADRATNVSETDDGSAVSWTLVFCFIQP
jgi:hypothetical protein